jgi:hypothetical protein
MAMFALLALLAINVGATDTASTFMWSYNSNDCSLAPRKSEVVSLDWCYATDGYFAMLSSNGTTYTYTLFSDPECSTRYAAPKPNPIIIAPGDCAVLCFAHHCSPNGTNISLTVRRTPGHAKELTHSWNCTKAATAGIDRGEDQYDMTNCKLNIANNVIIGDAERMPSALTSSNGATGSHFRFVLPSLITLAILAVCAARST